MARAESRGWRRTKEVIYVKRVHQHKEEVGLNKNHWLKKFCCRLMCQYLHCPQYVWVSKLAISRIGRKGLLYGRPRIESWQRQKKTSTELEYFKSITPLRRVLLSFGTTHWYSTPMPHLLCINYLSGWLTIYLTCYCLATIFLADYCVGTGFTFVQN